MRRIAISLTVMMLAVAGASGSTLTTKEAVLQAFKPAPIALPAMTPISGIPIVIAQGCCKNCNKGKPCGDSCISRAKQCHKGRGCAC